MFVKTSQTDSAPSCASSEDEEETQQPKGTVGKAPKTKDSKTKVNDSEYFVTPDNYFMMHSSKKVNTVLIMFEFKNPMVRRKACVN